MLKNKRTGLTTRDLPAARKPDPNFQPYDGPSITTANFQKFKKSPVVAAEETTEVPIKSLDDARAILEKANAKIDAEDSVSDICQGITKAGNPCKRAAMKGADFCSTHLKQFNMVPKE